VSSGTLRDPAQTRQRHVILNPEPAGPADDRHFPVALQRPPANDLARTSASPALPFIPTGPPSAVENCAAFQIQPIQPQGIAISPRLERGPWRPCRAAPGLRRCGPGATTGTPRCGSHVDRSTWEPHRDLAGWTPCPPPTKEPGHEPAGSCRISAATVAENKMRPHQTARVPDPPSRLLQSGPARGVTGKAVYC
jgi:hypothetical protein